jgi:hypothetical protein
MLSIGVQGQKLCMEVKEHPETHSNLLGYYQPPIVPLQMPDINPMKIELDLAKLIKFKMSSTTL